MKKFFIFLFIFCLINLLVFKFFVGTVLADCGPCELYGGSCVQFCTNAGTWWVSCDASACSTNGGGGCFTGETEITMGNSDSDSEKDGDSDGNSDLREIQDIKEGDVVKSFDAETGEVREATVTGIHKREVSGYWVLKTESGKEVKVTGEHPILVLNEKGEKVWRTVEEIEEGDYTFVLDETGSVIEKATDLSDFAGLEIIGKEIFEEDGQEYVLLKFDNGKELKLPADAELPIKDGKIILEPQIPEEKPPEAKDSLLKTLFSSLVNFVGKVF